MYIMDSVILSNYNNEIGGHAIAGITCNNQKYVYNGWTKYTNDPGLANKKNQEQFYSSSNNKYRKPCELMKHSWSVDKFQEFLLGDLQLTDCKLRNEKEQNDYLDNLIMSKEYQNKLTEYFKQRNIDNNDYSEKNKHLGLLKKAVKEKFSKNYKFSFNKGVRTIIYIKQDKDEQDNNEINTSNQYVSYSNYVVSQKVPEKKTLKQRLFGRGINKSTKYNKIKKVHVGKIL